jgi:hypothetical protein
MKELRLLTPISDPLSSTAIREAIAWANRSTIDQIQMILPLASKPVPIARRTLSTGAPLLFCLFVRKCSAFFACLRQLPWERKAGVWFCWERKRGSVGTDVLK